MTPDAVQSPVEQRNVLAYATPGADSALAPPPAAAKLRFVDALRGLAIFGVLVVHVTTTIRGLPQWIKPLGRDGARGVQLFYVISAFTLFLSMSRRSKRERRPTLNFFIRRFARIAPLFYAAVILYLLMYGLSYQNWRSAPSVTAATFITTLTFTNAWHPYWITALVPGGWSVAIEMCFYLTVPALFLVIKSWRAAIVFVVLALIVGMSLTSALDHHPPKEFASRRGRRHAASTRLPAAATQPTAPAAPDDQGAISPARAAPLAVLQSPIDAASSAAAPPHPHHHAHAASAQAAASQPLLAAPPATAPSPSAHAKRKARAAPAASFNRHQAWSTFLLFWLPNQLPVFALGILLFFIYEARAGRWRQAAEMRRLGMQTSHGFDLRWVSVLILLALAGYVALQLWALPRPVRAWLPDMLVYGILFVLLAIALAMYENPVLVNPFWTHLGKVSYSAYLLHWSMLLVLEKTLVPSLQRLPPLAHFAILLTALTLLTVGVATITFHLIEQPGQYLGKKLIRVLEHRAAATMPQTSPALIPTPASTAARQSSP